MRLVRKKNEVIVEETGLVVGLIKNEGVIFTRAIVGKIEFEEELGNYLIEQRNKTNK